MAKVPVRGRNSGLTAGRVLSGHMLAHGPEHDRWRKEGEAGGWRLAATKDETRKKSPDSIRYDDLAEDVNEIDREAVRAV